MIVAVLIEALVLLCVQSLVVVVVVLTLTFAGSAIFVGEANEITLDVGTILCGSLYVILSVIVSAPVIISSRVSSVLIVVVIVVLIVVVAIAVPVLITV